MDLNLYVYILPIYIVKSNVFKFSIYNSFTFAFSTIKTIKSVKNLKIYIQLCTKPHRSTCTFNLTLKSLQIVKNILRKTHIMKNFAL